MQGCCLVEKLKYNAVDFLTVCGVAFSRVFQEIRKRSENDLTQKQL